VTLTEDLRSTRGKNGCRMMVLRLLTILVVLLQATSASTADDADPKNAIDSAHARIALLEYLKKDDLKQKAGPFKELVDHILRPKQIQLLEKQPVVPFTSANFMMGDWVYDPKKGVCRTSYQDYHIELTLSKEKDKVIVSKASFIFPGKGKE
jgi:hypothetical protein